MLKERHVIFPVPAFLLAAFLLLVAGCEGREPEPTSAQYKADRDSIENVIRAIEEVYASGSPSYVDLYDEEPVVTLPGRPQMTNKREIAAFWKEFVDTYDAHQQLTTEEIIIAGDWAVVRNLFDLTLSPKSGAAPVRLTGRNQLVLRRQDDDSWKLARVIAYIDG